MRRSILAHELLEHLGGLRAGLGERLAVDEIAYVILGAISFVIMLLLGMMSIVAMARPAPFTMQPMVPSSLMKLSP